MLTAIFILTIFNTVVIFGIISELSGESWR